MINCQQNLPLTPFLHLFHELLSICQPYRSAWALPGLLSQWQTLTERKGGEVTRTWAFFPWGQSLGKLSLLRRYLHCGWNQQREPPPPQFQFALTDTWLSRSHTLPWARGPAGIPKPAPACPQKSAAVQSQPAGTALDHTHSRKQNAFLPIIPTCASRLPPGHGGRRCVSEGCFMTTSKEKSNQATFFKWRANKTFLQLSSPSLLNQL